jgi:fructose-1,6-bisphosphatase/inositol monophosphatase family enzyme
VLDPIDGTRGYLSGTPTWGVLISVRDDAGPIYGIIDQPYIGERFEGGLGRARVVGPMGEAALATRPARPLAESILFSTFPRSRHARRFRRFPPSGKQGPAGALWH